MSKINLLSSKIYNRIAAGEVVERPCSVVKELVENSIDASANQITIEIENGGVSSIIVTDNGGGIEKSELKKALLPHATSKISQISDLDAISSLGFRGEALASIASVSKITITSKPKNQDFGATISSDGGNASEVFDAPFADGTEIAVRNLFFNTPVRAKFLKTERSEENEITGVVSRFILGNPYISFKYYADGKLVLQSYGDGFESAMVKVYGSSIINDCFYIDTEKNGIKVNGYFGKHYFTKANRSFQTVFINGRSVINQTISSAIGNAYASYLMKRQYPFFVLSITVPSETVDVNVHPNKTEVRFMNNQIIYGSIYSVVSKVLDGTSEALNIVLDKKSPETAKENNIDKNLDFINGINNDYVRHNAPNVSTKICVSDRVNSLSIDEEVFSNQAKENEKSSVDIFAENKAYIEKIERERAEKIRAEKEQCVMPIDKELSFIGQALNTFLIYEDGNDLYFIDQHAAHERILFDKFNQALKESDIPTQPLLIPYILNVSNDEYEFVFNKLNVLKEVGVDIEEFGRNAFKISALPAFIVEINLETFFKSLLSDIDNLKNITSNDLLMEKIAKKACKSAIKSGDKLSETEVKGLWKMLGGNLGLKCPHGRPIAVKITRTEIDKWFKRII